MAKERKSASQDGFTILEGLAGVRMTPTMYLGSLGQDMAYRCVKEPVDNCYDEHIAGRNNLIEVILNYDDDIYIIADKAGGIPTDYKKLENGEKETIMTAAFTRVHAGGKFNDKAYKTSAGTHGTGVAAVNAVSDEMRVWSNYNDKLVVQTFARGKITSKGKDPVRCKAVDDDVASLLQDKPRTYGTIVAFQLDQTVVSESARRGKALPKNYVHAEPEAKQIANWLRNVAHLNPGLEIRMTVVRKKKSKTVKFLNTKNLAWIPQHMCERHEFGTLGKPFVFKSDNISCALIWADHPDTDYFLTFVNTSPTIDGGYHVTGFMTALGAAIKDYLPKPKGKKKSGPGFSNADLLIGIVGMFDWRMHGAQYTSQVKDKLASRVDREVHDIMLPLLQDYFKANQKVAKTIIKRAQTVNQGREALAAVVRSLADAKKTVKGNALPAELSAAEDCTVHERELYLVEGDSAGGTAKNSRDARFQEVLKSGGKPLNALSNPLSKVLAHAEIQNLLVSMGVNIKTLDPKAENPTFSTEGMRVRNVFFLVDPDPDGGHIAVLFLAAIYRLIPDLFKEGRVWCVESPLFAAVHNGKVYGGDTFAECRDKAPAAVKDKEITRIKGWGEVNDDVLGPIAFNVTQRRLIKINPFENTEQMQFFRGIVGEEAFNRRKLLGLED